MLKVLNSFVIALTIFSSSVPLALNSEEYVKFDSTTIESDLENAGYDVSGIQSLSQPKFIDFIEYAYGSEYYGLYFYVYIPTSYDLDLSSSLNKIQLAVASNSNYQKYSIECLDEADNIYKFKVNFTDEELSMIMDRLSNFERVYQVSGFEIKDINSSNATEYAIGGKYKYSGFAKGIDGNTSSTLTRKVKEIETLSLDVQQTYYNFEGDNFYDDHYQLNSVYFSIPNQILNEYGEIYAINFEYYEYKTSPIIFLRESVYDYFDDYIGVVHTEENNPGKKLVYDVYDATAVAGSNLRTCDLVDKDLGGQITGTPYFKENNYLTWLFSVPEGEETTFTREQLLNYLYSYDKSYYNGKNYRGLSMDLLNGTVDEGHTQGYNKKVINSDDTYSIDIKLRDFWSSIAAGFGHPQYEELELDPFIKIDSTNINNENYISDLDLNDFKTFVSESNSKNESTYLFRFNLGKYQYAPIYDVTYGDLFREGRDGYVYELNLFLDFDIIDITFMKDGITTIIPAVSNPIDIISNIVVPAVPEYISSKIITIIKIVILIALIILGIFLLNQLFGLFGISFKDIFNFIFVKPFKWVKGKFEGNKKKKSNKNKKRTKK